MATMTKIRTFPESRVEAEMEWMSRHRIFGIVVCDANFGIFPRDIGFIRRLGQLTREGGFPRRVKITGYAKNQKERPFLVTSLLREHRLLGSDPATAVNFSVQSLSTLALDAVNRTNIPLSGYRQTSDLYRDSGITITPDLILPLPGETAASFKAGYADLAALDHVAHIVVYPCIVLPNAPMAGPSYRERWGIVTKTERTLAPIPGIEDEEDEIVVATGAMTAEELADCKVFVSVVEAFELHGVLRCVRQYLARTGRVATDRFYDDFISWQASRQGGLARVLSAIRAFAAANPTLPLAAGHDTRYHPQLFLFGRVRSSKVIMYDALSQPGRFVEELRRFLHERYDWSDDSEREELLRFQSDGWITPLYDPSDPVDDTFDYAHDWPAFLSGRDPVVTRRATRATRAPRQDWLDAGYRRASLLQWVKFALAPGSDRTMQCCREHRTMVQGSDDQSECRRAVV
jgi:hypothetical protein